MLKNKKIVLTLFLLASLLDAKTLLNGISMLVNEEPITLFEIHKVAKMQNIPIKNAVEILVEKSLRNAQVKKLGIKASEYEVSQEISNIASKNDMNSYEMLNLIKSKGVSEEEYREDIAQGIKSRKLFERIFKNKFDSVGEKEARAYYEKNKDKFTQASAFDVTIYNSRSQTGLRRSLQNPMAPNMGVNIERKTLHAKNLDKKNIFFLNQTPKGKFTPIMRTKNGYVMYMVNAKIGYVALSFKEAKPLIQEYVAKQNEKSIINEYFKKLKAQANIEVLRKP